MAENDPVPDNSVPDGQMRVQSENIAFTPDEMVVCTNCGRKNPPNRIQCIYCAGELDINPDKSHVTPKLRPAEEWEPGFNIILRSIVGIADPRLARIALILAAEPGYVSGIAATKRPMPIARVGSKREAELVVDALKREGLDTLVVSDELLMPDRPPVRLRGIDFDEDSLGLVEFNTGNSMTIVRNNLALIVSGVVAESRTDQIEKKRRGKEPKVLERVETGRDEAVLDIYDRRDPFGYRVMLAGFDFSCLGEDKGYLAVENIRRLVTVLCEFAPNAHLVSDYRDVRSEIGSVWPIDERQDPQGLQRSGFAKFDFGKTISSSNMRQLNRFSRLQWHLL